MAEEGIIMGTTALTLVGLTATEWTVVGIITGVSGTTLATILGITKEEADKIQAYVKKFQKNSKLVKPGQKYSWSAPTNFNMRVYVMNDKMQTEDRFTLNHPIIGCEYVYPISKYFTKLDVKKTKNDTITIYK